MDGRWLEAVLEERAEEVPERPAQNPVLYYKTRTIRAGALTDVEIYPVYQGAYRRQLSRVRATSEAQRTVNDRNAMKRFIRMAHANFVPGRDFFLTLTYDGPAPEDMDRCNRDFRTYMQRVNRKRKRMGLEPARCIAVLETGKNGRLHHHALIEGGMSRDIMESLWEHGAVNCNSIQGGPAGLSRLASYMTKGFTTKRDTGRHRYYYTRNLKKPRITESRTRVSRRQAERIREDADLYGAEIIRKKWPGLVPEGEIVVKHSDWLPGAYIYVRLRQP